MNKFKGVLPVVRPEIAITPKKNVSFDISVNEVPWMYCSLTIGDQTIWGIYDAPEWKLTDCCVTKTLGRAKIHNIDCVQIELNDYSNPEKTEPDKTHCLYIHADEQQIQYVAASTIENDVFKMITLYDEEFIKNYGIEFGRRVKDVGFGIYTDEKYNSVKIPLISEQFTIGAGVFDVKIGGKTFECLRVLDRWEDSPRILVENYMSREGRSILFRRYNHPVWKLERYGQRWDEKLPNANRISINGEEYIHWYDCLSDIAF